MNCDERTITYKYNRDLEKLNKKYKKDLKDLSKKFADIIVKYISKNKGVTEEIKVLYDEIYSLLQRLFELEYTYEGGTNWQYLDGFIHRKLMRLFKTKNIEDYIKITNTFVDKNND